MLLIVGLKSGSVLKVFWRIRREKVVAKTRVCKKAPTKMHELKMPNMFFGANKLQGRFTRGYIIPYNFFHTLSVGLA